MMKQRGRPNAVQGKYGPHDADFSPVPAKPVLNQSKRIGKPFLPDPNTSKVGVVPLYTLQKGSINEVPVVNKEQKLVAPMPVPSVIRMADTTTEVTGTFPIYAYNEGIRPSVRPLLAFP